MAFEHGVIQSAILAEETTFASPSGKTHDTSVFNIGRATPFQMFEGEFPAPLTLDRNDMSSLLGDLPPHVISSISGGTRLPLYQGSITLDFDAQGMGALVSLAPDDLMLNMILRAMLTDGGSPGDSADYSDAIDDYHSPAPGSYPASANVFKPTDNTKYTEGGLIKVDYGDRARFLRVLKVDAGDDVIVTDPAPAQLDSNYTARICRNYTPGAASASLALRLDIGNGARVSLFGMRTSKLEWENDGTTGAILRMSVTFQYVSALYDNANVSVSDVEYDEGPNMEWNNGEVLLTEALADYRTPGTAPYVLDRLAAEIRPDSIKVSLEAQIKVYRGQDGLGCSYLLVPNVKLMVDITLSESVVVDDDFVNKRELAAVLSWGPTGVGAGMGISIPAAVFKADTARRVLDDQRVMQAITLTNGKPRGAASNNHSFVIGLPH